MPIIRGKVVAIVRKSKLHNMLEGQKVPKF
jgi:hypothetical protein